MRASWAGECILRDLQPHSEILGVFDSDAKKQGKDFFGYKISDYHHEKPIFLGRKIIIANNTHYKEIAACLIGDGYREDIDFCYWRKLSYVFHYYNFGHLHFDYVEISITNRCTLACEKCGLFMPMFKSPKDRSVISIKRDIDAYFSWVDFVSRFRVMGGEPFLHPELTEILDYLHNKWGSRIGEIICVSNATVKLSNDVLKSCKKNNVSIHISDYSEAVPKIKKLIDQFENALDEWAISYEHPQQVKWQDLGFPNTVHEDKEELVRLFNNCKTPCRSLYNEKLYFCAIQASAEQLGEIINHKDDYWELNRTDYEQKINLLEFNLGYLPRGYVEFCTRCDGTGEANKKVICAGEQVLKKIT